MMNMNFFEVISSVLEWMNIFFEYAMQDVTNKLTKKFCLVHFLQRNFDFYQLNYSVGVFFRPLLSSHCQLNRKSTDQCGEYIENV